MFHSLRSRSERSFLPLALATLLALGIQTTALSQTQKKVYPGDAYNLNGKRLTTPLTWTDAPGVLKEKVSLPDLPEYTGKCKFLHGLSYTSFTDSKQGPAYVMYFSARESEQQLRDWWLSSLRTYKWNVTYSSKDIVQGTSKDGNTCIVQISGKQANGPSEDQSSFSIRYQCKK